MESVAGRSVLLVEDHAATRALVARQLRRTGLDVTAVESGERVLGEIADRFMTFDVVILDVHLPGMSGLDLASLIQARRPRQPIVLVTGDSDPGLTREALARGPVSFLLKPFEMYELHAAVKRALVRRSAEAAEEPGASAAAPRRWLDLVEAAYFGSVHARRTGRLAAALAEALPGIETRLDVGDMLVVAWAHGLAPSAPEASPPHVAVERARLLAEQGGPLHLTEAVKRVAEHHDGTGGPDGIAGDAIPLMSQVVAAASTLAHATVAALREDVRPADAVERALGILVARRGTRYRPEVVDAARRQRERLVAICADMAADDARTAAA